MKSKKKKGNKQKLFLLQRFQIMALAANSGSECKISDGYAFAWSESIYPFLHENAVWHPLYENCFNVREEELVSLYRLLNKAQKEGKDISYCELERRAQIYTQPSGFSSLGPVWSRKTLIKALRYFYLSYNGLEKSFWSTLLELEECPAEAHNICLPFDKSHICFE